MYGDEYLQYCVSHTLTVISFRMYLFHIHIGCLHIFLTLKVFHNINPFKCNNYGGPLVIHDDGRAQSWQPASETLLLFVNKRPRIPCVCPCVCLCVCPCVCPCVCGSPSVWPPAVELAASACVCAAGSAPSAAPPAAGRSPAASAKDSTRPPANNEKTSNFELEKENSVQRFV